MSTLSTNANIDNLEICEGINLIARRELQDVGHKYIFSLNSRPTHKQQIEWLLFS